MAGRPGYVQRTFRLKPDTVALLDRYSRATGVSRTFAVEKAISEYLARNSDRGAGPGTCAPEKKGDDGTC